MKSAAALLFACLAGVIFYLAPDPLGSGDVIGTQLTPIALLTQGNIRLDAFVPHYQTKNNGLLPYFFHPTSTGIISNYPIAIAVLATPIYAIPVLGHLENTPENRIQLARKLGKLSAAIFAALAVFVFWKTCSALGATPSLSFWLSVAFAFGSELLTTGSQALWMHGPGVLFLLLATFWSLRCQKIHHALLVGLVCGIAVCIRPTNLLFVAPLWLWLLAKKPSHAFWAAIPGGILAGALVYYNETCFGQLGGAYDITFDSSWLDGLSGVLISPASGLLIYFPVALFGFWGIWKGVQESPRSIYGVFAVFIFAGILLIAKWDMWHGGHCYGPRLLSEIQPFLLLGTIPIASYSANRPLVGLWFLLLVWSLFAQIVGLCFFRAGQWPAYPDNVDTHHERLWDWRDNPINRAIFAAAQPVMPNLREWKASYSIRETSLSIAAGDTYPLKVKIQNTGIESWLRWIGKPSIYLSYRILGANGEIRFIGLNRGLFDHAIAPGESATVVLPVESDLPPGSYRLEISFQQSGVASFAEKGVAPLLIPILVP